MYIVYLRVTLKSMTTFEFATMELAEQFCLAVTQAEDVQSAMICKHDTGKNMLILGTYAQGQYLG
nr:MAG TPA: hypothetical protein [Caudoviricetes sp.]